MKYLALIFSLVAPVLSHATFIAGPAISCSPSKVFDAGLSLVVTEGDHGFVGELYQNSYSGPKSLGTEKVLIEVRKDDGPCRLKISQENDVDGNEMEVEVQASQSGGRNFSKLDMILNGQRIDPLYSEMHCYIEHMTFNKLCNPSYDGALHQQSNAQKVTY